MVRSHRPFRIDQCVFWDHGICRRDGLKTTAEQSPLAPAKCLNRGDQRALLLNVFLDHVGQGSEMLSDKPVAKGCNDAVHQRLAACLDRHIAFRVESHGTIGNIGRPKADECVIDDQQFAMHRNRFYALVSRHDRRIHAQSTIVVGQFHFVQKLRPQIVHRLALQPAIAMLTEHQDHVRTIMLRQPLRQHPADGLGRKILRLDVDGSACALEGRQIGLFNLASFFQFLVARLSA